MTWRHKPKSGKCNAALIWAVMIYPPFGHILLSISAITPPICGPRVHPKQKEAISTAGCASEKPELWNINDRYAKVFHIAEPNIPWTAIHWKVRFRKTSRKMAQYCLNSSWPFGRGWWNLNDVIPSSKPSNKEAKPKKEEAQTPAWDVECMEYRNIFTSYERRKETTSKSTNATKSFRWEER